jgi:hypothetical protein
MPLADGLLAESELCRDEPRYPLAMAFCPDCTLVQIVETVPDDIDCGDDHLSFSSCSDALLEYSRERALALDVRTFAGDDVAVARLLDEELRVGIDRPVYYQRFARRVEKIRTALHRMIGELRARGKRIAAYGAAAAGTVMLNYLGLDRRSLEYVVDRNVHTHGRYLPGVRLAVHDPARLVDDRPDFVLILPWSCSDEIMAQQTQYVAAGGRFIVPIPEPVIV